MQTANVCPVCGRPFHRPGKLTRFAGAVGAWRTKRLTTMQSTAALAPWQPQEASQPAPGGYVEASRITPIRPQNLESDFLTPLFQALGTGAFVTAGGLLLAWSSPTFTWVFGLTVGLLAAAIHWGLAIIWNPENLKVIETIVRSDLDGDGAIGQPAPPISLEVTHTSATDPSFHQMFRFELPAGIDEALFTDFASGVIHEARGLAESSWTGSKRPFSKPKYNDLLDVLTKAGLVRWKNPNAPAQGRELTPAGGRALRSWLNIARKHTQPSTGATNFEFIDV